MGSKETEYWDFGSVKVITNYLVSKKTGFSIVKNYLFQHYWNIGKLEFSASSLQDEMCWGKGKGNL